MNEFSPTVTQVLPGELGEDASEDDFERVCFESVQEYALLMNAAHDLESLRRLEETTIACELDRVTGVIRSHIKWAQKRGIKTTDLEGIVL